MWECQKKARCINCRGTYPANHCSCPVYSIYANAANERHANRIIASIPDARIEGVSIEPAVRAAHANPDCSEKPTFAAVVGTGRSFSYRKIVKKTKKGEELVCQIPLVAAQPKRAKSAAPAKTKLRATRNVPPLKETSVASFSEVLELAKRVWTFIKPMIEPLFKDNTALAPVIDILMSDAAAS